MADRNNLDRLNQLPADNGRLIAEKGNVVNQASYLATDAFGSDRLMSVRGRLFFATPRFTVPSGGSRTITINVSTNKYFVQYQREINVESAKWNVQGIVGGTSSGGTTVKVNNSFTASTNINESTISIDSTISGGEVIQDLLVPAGSRRSAGFIGAGTSFVVIYPPGETASIVLSHDDSVSREVQVVYEFAELTQEEFDTIQDIFIE